MNSDDFFNVMFDQMDNNTEGNDFLIAVSTLESRIRVLEHLTNRLRATAIGPNVVRFYDVPTGLNHDHYISGYTNAQMQEIYKFAATEILAELIRKYTKISKETRELMLGVNLLTD